MKEWHRILSKVLRHGERRNDRTGAGTLALFAEQLVFDNRDTFPAVTTKRLAFAPMAAELACFLRGASNLEEFHALGCNIWDGNGTASYWDPREPGDLGRIYGVQWRDWISVDRHGCAQHLDQLRALVDGIRAQPHGRRHVVTALNPGEFQDMCLPPCHVMFQAFVSSAGAASVPRLERLDLAVYMRSVDLFLGLPFDVASYALLQRLLAREVGMDSGFLTFFLGDAHIYLNHVEQANLVLSREPLEPPTLALDPAAGLFNFAPRQASLAGYNHCGAVAAPLNV